MSAIPAVHCEARKVSYRQTKDGLVVSFVIHPQEMPDALAVAPLGQRYMLALAAIGDDEKPVPVEANRLTIAHHVALPDNASSEDVGRAFAGITRSEQGKAAYIAKNEMERAVTRAALLAKEPRFREWLTEEYGDGHTLDEPDAAEEIRAQCRISSRSEIGTDRRAYGAFIKYIETPYLIATGAIAEPR